MGRQQLDISDGVAFLNNSAGGGASSAGAGGGAIFMQYTVTASLADTNFTSNSAAVGTGGAIYATYG